MKNRYFNDAWKVVAFVVVTGLMTALVGVTIGEFRIQDTTTYRAVFRDVSGLQNGVEVRAAGVKLGRVDHLALRADNTVQVSFSVPTYLPVTQQTRATIRYKNITGDRYLDLTEGTGSGQRLTPNGVIPLANTTPALDLDQLFNGFKPLFRALDPDQVNQLSASLIAVFQGQAGTVNSLLDQVATLTTTLGNRDRLIGEVIGNLNSVLGTMTGRRDEFSNLIVQLQDLVSGLATDRKQIGSSLVRINDLAGTTADWLRVMRPEVQGTLAQARRFSAAINSESAQVDHYLSILPDVFKRLGRQGTYGAFYNFYICGIRSRIASAGGVDTYTPFIMSEVPRCQFAE